MTPPPSCPSSPSSSSPAPSCASLSASLGARATDFDSVILAGGLATRMNGADKPELEVGGRPMLVSVAAAAASAGTGRLIVVGPRRGGAVGRGLATLASGLPGGLITVCEEPPGSGPVAAVRRGLSEVRAPWVALLAADMPFLTGEWLTALLAAGAAGGRAGAMLADDTGRAQWLAGCWQTARLRASLGTYQGGSLGGLLGPLQPAIVPADTAGQAPWQDCDSPAELAAARAAQRREDGAR
jgi:molybdopterin-guanine dinucleotide biosynthesis protein A